MHSYFSAIAKAYPSTVGPAFKSAVTSSKSIDEVRVELMQKRFEYWYRKVYHVGNTWAQAKNDFTTVCVALKNPSELTYKQVATGGVCALHIVGAFCIGEMIARGSLQGYKVGPANLH